MHFRRGFYKMFDRPARILAHKSVLQKGNYATPDYILTNSGLLNRYCPHRSYPLKDIGSFSQDDIVCKFHGFSWNNQGTPINNDRNIKCGSANEGKSGLIFKNFNEPNHRWVDDLADEKNLQYSHCMQGSSKGSWLWMMEIQADLLHIRNGTDVIHPELASVTDLDATEMFEGDDWILQTCSTGWWLFIYPFTFIEWSPGCLSVNYTTPHDINNEMGFDWITQFYYDPKITQEKKKEFETLEDVFKEDVDAIEKQKSKWFPILKPYNRLENHCVHFGHWVKQNLKIKG